jgi:predicted DNA repair protein MutK
VDLIRVYETEENGHKGIMVVYDDLGYAWSLAEQAAKKLGRELLESVPRAIRRDDKIHRFFEFKP